MPRLAKNILISLCSLVSNAWPVEWLQEKWALTDTAERFPNAGKHRIEFE